MVHREKTRARRNTISRLKELTRRQIAALRSRTFSENFLSKVPVMAEPGRLDYVAVKRSFQSNSLG